LQDQEGLNVGDHILPAGDNEVFVVLGFYLLDGGSVIEIQPAGGGSIKIAHANDMKLFTKLHPYKVPMGFMLHAQDVDG